MAKLLEIQKLCVDNVVNQITHGGRTCNDVPRVIEKKKKTVGPTEWKKPDVITYQRDRTPPGLAHGEISHGVRAVIAVRNSCSLLFLLVPPAARRGGGYHVFTSAATNNN